MPNTGRRAGSNRGAPLGEARDVAAAGAGAARLPVALLLLGLIAGVTHAWAMTEDDRPRTALVLSGGGARGAAHIGVLQVLEANNVAVDCVVGTSMGSIVGGLYAAGWSPEELYEQVVQTDWEDAFDDSPARKQTSYRRKQDDFLPVFPAELGFGRDGFKVPSGLIAGQKLGFLLRVLTLRVGASSDFDRLPLPYRAVATDLEDGSMVVLEDGSLADAMRASMSIPGVFTPVTLDGRKLIDGGIVRNLPVDVGRALCADRPQDRVLAVDIGTVRDDLEDDAGLVEVVARTFSVLNKRNVAISRGELRESDVLITPELGSVTAASFDRLPDAVAAGRLAAEASLASLDEFASSPAEFAAWRDGLRRPDRGDIELRVGEVTVEGAQRVDPRQIAARIRIEPGETVDADRLSATLLRVYQMGEFENVDFEVSPAAEGVDLSIRVTEKSWGPGYLRTGLRLESNLEGDSEFLAVSSYRRSQVNRLAAEWRVLLTVGDENRLFTEFFQPFDFGGRAFIAPFAEISRNEVVEPTGEFGAVDVESASAGFDLGLQFGNYGEFRIGVETGEVSLSSAAAPDAFGDIGVGGLRASAVLDRLDDTEFPRRGSFAGLSFYRSDESLGADGEFDRLELGLFRASPVGPRTTVIAELDLGAELSGEIPDFDEFFLGGFLNLSGLRPFSLRGDVSALGTVGVLHQLPNSLFLGAALESGSVWDDLDDTDFDDLLTSGLVFVGRKTFVGPFYLGYSMTEDGDDSWYFFLGRFIN